ncbi:FUT2-like protein, partial [Mya arenaria]
MVETLDTSRNWTLGGYRHSWKYFANATNEVRQMFTLKSEYTDKAKEFLGNISSAGICCERLRTCQKRRHVTVSLHLSRESPHGSGVSKKFNNRTLDFVIISDGMKWCKNNLFGSDVFYSPFQTGVLDFALMVCCDHVIVTIGTFGWWGAWLSDEIT